MGGNTRGGSTPLSRILEAPHIVGFRIAGSLPASKQAIGRRPVLLPFSAPRTAAASLTYPCREIAGRDDRGHVVDLHGTSGHAPEAGTIDRRQDRHSTVALRCESLKSALD